jgi:hypothetical protein
MFFPIRSDEGCDEWQVYSAILFRVVELHFDRKIIRGLDLNGINFAITADRRVVNWFWKMVI